MKFHKNNKTKQCANGLNIVLFINRLFKKQMLLKNIYIQCFIYMYYQHL